MGVGGGEAARGGSALIEAGVEAAGGGGKQLGERIDVSALELGELAIFEDFAGDGVVGGRGL